MVFHNNNNNNNEREREKEMREGLRVFPAVGSSRGERIVYRGYKFNAFRDTWKGLPHKSIMHSLWCSRHGIPRESEREKEREGAITIIVVGDLVKVAAENVSTDVYFLLGAKVACNCDNDVYTTLYLATSRSAHS